MKLTPSPYWLVASTRLPAWRAASARDWNVLKLSQSTTHCSWVAASRSSPTVRARLSRNSVSGLVSQRV